MNSEKRSLLAAAILALLSSGAVDTAMACTDIVVTNLADEGPGSLRQALLDVCPAGVITFDPSLNGQTLVLGSGQLVVNKDLSINGPGANQLSLSGGKNDRGFQILAGATVRITGITIRDGKTAERERADFGLPGNGGDGGEYSARARTSHDSPLQAWWAISRVPEGMATVPAAAAMGEVADKVEPCSQRARYSWRTVYWWTTTREKVVREVTSMAKTGTEAAAEAFRCMPPRTLRTPHSEETARATAGKAAKEAMVGPCSRPARFA